MSAVTTNTFVAAVAKVAVFTKTALAIILLPCPTFVAWSFMFYLNFHSHFLHFALCFGTKDPDRVGVSRLWWIFVLHPKKRVVSIDRWVINPFNITRVRSHQRDFKFFAAKNFRILMTPTNVNFQTTL